MYNVFRTLLCTMCCVRCVVYNMLCTVRVYAVTSKTILGLNSVPSNVSMAF